MNSFSSSYYLALAAGYAVGLAGWWLISRWKPAVWTFSEEFHFAHPWRETVLAFLAALATIGVGMLYTAGMLIGKGAPGAAVLREALNQTIIFSPFLLLVIVRRQPLSTAWLSRPHLPERIAAGIVLALAAICAFVLLRPPSDGLGAVLGNVYHPKNAGYAVQIFLEDFAIAVFFVRFRAAIGERWFLVVLITVAVLFSASHYPSKLGEGLSFLAATREVAIDAALVSAAIVVLQRSKDIVWFWFLHCAMDMMQFYAA